MKGWKEMKERVKEWMDELTEGLKGRNHVKKIEVESIKEK